MTTRIPTDKSRIVKESIAQIDPSETAIGRPTATAHRLVRSDADGTESCALGFSWTLDCESVLGGHQIRDPHEIEANQFAAALLMPEAFLRACLDQLGENPDVEESIRRLAQRFDVSAQAMTIRLTSLGDITPAFG